VTPRVSPFDPVSASAEQHQAYDEFVSDRGGDTGAPNGVYDVILRSPGAARRLAALGAFCRFGTGLDPGVVEAAILATSHALPFQYGIDSHEDIGRRAGLTEEELAHLRAGQHGPLPEPLRLAADLGRAAALGDVPADLVSEAVAHFGEASVVDLSVVAGYYGALCLVARCLNPELAGGHPHP
jgi:4-carboxymuconolactone decarboxylase